ncbi:MAG: hypothetical protein VKI39_07750 [Synechococcus sp.]|nr:hypothetical protein [Synechococcus sp.]
MLRLVVSQPRAPRNLGQAIHARFAATGGIDVPPAERGAMRRRTKVAEDGGRAVDTRPDISGTLPCERSGFG